MRNIVILDLDGVMITTPSWRSDEIGEDGYSQFNIDAVANLNALMNDIDAELWLSSTRRLKKTLDEFRLTFKRRNIDFELRGFLPAGEFGIRRNVEIDHFLDVETCTNFLILDDDSSLHLLEQNKKYYWVQTDPLVGFDAEKLKEARLKTKSWT